MLRTYSKAVALVALSLLSIQVFPQLHRTPFIAPSAHHEAGKEQAMQRASAVTLWSEDFESGLNGWTNNTVNGPVEWLRTNTGNTGGFTPGPLQSTTGFPTGYWIVADSDLLGSPGVNENTSITSPPITGLDTVPYMLLRFEQSFRQLNTDQTDVQVSGDGGANWSTYEINRGVPGNSSTPGAPLSEVIILNISDALNGGSNDIRIRFRWISTEGYTYSWQVDDIALLAPADNDLRILSATYANWNFDDGNFLDLPYSIYPQNELRELKFKVVYINNGSTPQTGVHLQVDVDGPGPNDVQLNSAVVVPPVQPGATDSLFITGYVPVSVLGHYSLEFSLLQNETEDEPGDNTRVLGFDVAEYTFARDKGMMEGDYANGAGAYEIGNWYHVQDFSNVLHGIDVALSSQTDVGTIIQGTLYDANRDFVMETQEHVVTASERNTLGQGNFIQLPLTFPVPLDDDSDYLVTVGHFGGSAEVWVATSGNSPAQSSSFYDGSNSTWFYVTSTPMVRMNFDPTVGIQDVEGNVGSIHARPTAFSESTIIRVELLRSTDARWELRNTLGQVVNEGMLGQLPSGVTDIPMDGTGLSAGPYLFILHTGTSSTTLRVVRNNDR